VRFISFSDWSRLNESATFEFDPLARYPDPNFGLDKLKGEVSPVSPGGVDSNWGGSMPRALAFAKIANDYMGKNVISFQKGNDKLTTAGNESDHYLGNTTAYAVDLAVSAEEGDLLLAYLMAWFGNPEYKGGAWLSVVKNGYRYQVAWKVKDHMDKIHIGVKKVDIAGTESSKVAGSNVTAVPGNTFAEKLVNNQEFLTWYAGYAPSGNASPTAKFIEGYITENPEKKNWFMERFNLNSDGDRLNKVSDTAGFGQGKETSNNTITTQNVKTNYTGEKARNVDLLVSEMKAQGITNRHAILGMLATIGKESGFLPKNEIPYNNTSNGRIRKIFGSRVKDLSDTELDALKKDTVKFWNRVYGPDDVTGNSQRYGNSEPGDGAKYLGRGFNGITFKGNYKKYGDIIGMDLVSNPEVLNDVKVAAKAAVVFLLNVLKRMKIDPNSFTDTESALTAFVKANHGGSYAPQENFTRAREVLKNLEVN